MASNFQSKPVVEEPEDFEEPHHQYTSWRKGNSNGNVIVEELEDSEVLKVGHVTIEEVSEDWNTNTSQPEAEPEVMYTPLENSSSLLDQTTQPRFDPYRTSSETFQEASDYIKEMRKETSAKSQKIDREISLAERQTMDQMITREIESQNIMKEMRENGKAERNQININSAKNIEQIGADQLAFLEESERRNMIDAQKSELERLKKAKETSELSAAYAQEIYKKELEQEEEEKRREEAMKFQMGFKREQIEGQTRQVEDESAAIRRGREADANDVIEKAKRDMEAFLEEERRKREAIQRHNTSRQWSFPKFGFSRK